MIEVELEALGPQHRHTGELGNGFLENLQSFACQHRRNVCEPGDVTSGSRETVNQPDRNRITQVHKTIGIVLVAFLAAKAAVMPGGDEHVNFETNEFIG